MRVWLLVAAKSAYVRANERHPSLTRLLRFLISGGTATVVNLGTLFVLTHYFSIWYLLSSVIAFGISFLISFTLQKLWTFQSRSHERTHIQAALFLGIILLGLGINTALVYLSVEYAHIHYIVAQLISGFFVAVMNYFSYKHLVFRDILRA